MSDEFEKSDWEIEEPSPEEKDVAEKAADSVNDHESENDNINDNIENNISENSDNESDSTSENASNEDLDDTVEDEFDEKLDDDFDYDGEESSSNAKLIGIIIGIIALILLIIGIVMSKSGSGDNKESSSDDVTSVPTSEIQTTTANIATTAESKDESTAEETTPVENTAEETTTPEETTEETTEEPTTPDPYEGYDRKRMTVWNHYPNLGVVSCPYYLNIRTIPSLEGDVIGILYNLSGVDLKELSEDGQWYHIISNGIEGYINAEFVKTGEEAKQLAYDNAFPSVRVIADVLNVRELPTTDSKVLTQIIANTLYNVEEETNEEWLKINLSAEISGYVHRDFVIYEYTLLDAFAYEPPKVEEVPSINPVRTGIVNTALQYVGGKYVWGGTSLGVGVDCSGFVLKVYEMYGYTLPRTSYWQVDMGVPVAYEDMKPGDLLFYWNHQTGRVGHVAIYMGNNQIVHAASEARGIVVDDYRYMTPYCARNIIGE